MDISKKFGKKFKTIRLKKGMSQGDIAKKLDVGASYISKIERGTENVSLRVIQKLAKTLGVSVGELVK